MSSIIKYSVLISSALLLSGCAMSYHFQAPNKNTGRFQTGSRVHPNQIIVNKSLALNSYKKLLVVGVKSDAMYNYYNQQAFWVKSLRSLGYFKQVVAINNLGNFLIQHGYGNRAPSNVYSILGLHQLQRVYGNFLFASIYTNCDLGSSSCRTDFKIINPANSVIYFRIKRSVFNWDGLDSVLFYPILNSFRAWLDNNK